MFGDEDTDILIAWDGKIEFTVFAGRFNGEFDLIDTFHRSLVSLEAAREASRRWFHAHATFNPGP